MPSIYDGNVRFYGYNYGKWYVFHTGRKEIITCSFCNFGIMAWLGGEIDENGETIKDKCK